MKWESFLLLAALALLFWVVVCEPTRVVSSADGPVVYRVIPKGSAKELWLESYLPTPLNFRVVKGEAPQGGVLHCQAEEVSLTHSDHSDKLVVLNCVEGLRLELQGLDLRSN